MASARSDDRGIRPLPGKWRRGTAADCGWPHELRGAPGRARPGGCRDQLDAIALRAGGPPGEAAGMKGYASLRRKLTTLIAGAGVVAAVIAAVGFSWLDLQRFQQQANAQVTAIANIVAGQVEPSIALGDRRAAAEILQSLRGDRMIRDAILYDGEGECFAVARASLAACPPPPRDGLEREREAIVLVRPVLSE